MPAEAGPGPENSGCCQPRAARGRLDEDGRAAGIQGQGHEHTERYKALDQDAGQGDARGVARTAGAEGACDRRHRFLMKCKTKKLASSFS